MKLMFPQRPVALRAPAFVTTEISRPGKLIPWQATDLPIVQFSLPQSNCVLRGFLFGATVITWWTIPLSSVSAFTLIAHVAS